MGVNFQRLRGFRRELAGVGGYLVWHNSRHRILGFSRACRRLLGLARAGATALLLGMKSARAGRRLGTRDLVLAGLSPANGLPHSPVQVQKLFFLLDRNLPSTLGAPFFSFEPYDYGPFDRAVYDELVALAADGLVEVAPSLGSRWRTYRLTSAGQMQGDEVLSRLEPAARQYIEKANSWVRSLSFTELVSAIYRAFPDMRVNSVFEEA